MIVQPPALMDHWDDFDRANSTDLGPNWRPDFDSCQIFNQQVQISTPAQLSARQGAWETYVAPDSHNGGRLITDNWEVAAEIGTPAGGIATDNATAIGCGMLDNGPAAGMCLVYAIFFQGTQNATNAMAIYTYINASIVSPGGSWGVTPATSRAAVTNRVAAGDIIRFRRRMYSPTQSVFQLIQNGILRVSWNDSVGIVPAGQANRRRWFLSCEGNAAGAFSGQYYSPAIANIRAHDRPY
ncbi:hypothetical protein [Nocardia sp. CA-290969]|uniref:hypothetical protein n=1 Tax=Nocardia sp. CA-290969 TaxID=3239986 RepID=UPI003D9117D2